MSSSRSAPTTVAIHVSGPVATVILRARVRNAADRHYELAGVFSRLREDDAVRVIVLTGSGTHFLVPPRWTPASSRRWTDPSVASRTLAGIIRCHETMAEMEKPIVARVNGDAIGFGSSLAFASDIIVAAAEARFRDHHLGMDEAASYQRPFSIVPGDGGTALLPLYMTPPLAKEYLMLARSYTARDLARRGLINYAVPRSRLDRTVDVIVARLVRRDPRVLGWTKRLANRNLVRQLHLALDSGAAYEVLSLVTGARHGRFL